MSGTGSYLDFTRMLWMLFECAVYSRLNCPNVNDRKSESRPMTVLADSMAWYTTEKHPVWGFFPCDVM